jgi:hypothetical protein
MKTSTFSDSKLFTQTPVFTKTQSMAQTANATASNNFTGSFYWNMSKKVASGSQMGLYASIFLLSVVGLAFWVHSLRLTSRRLMIDEQKAQKNMIDAIWNGMDFDLSDFGNI